MNAMLLSGASLLTTEFTTGFTTASATVVLGGRPCAAAGLSPAERDRAGIDVRRTGRDALPTGASKHGTALPVLSDDATGLPPRAAPV